jgi:hypothetical protein
MLQGRESTIRFIRVEAEESTALLQFSTEQFHLVWLWKTYLHKRVTLGLFGKQTSSLRARIIYLLTYSVALVRKRTIPNERPSKNHPLYIVDLNHVTNSLIKSIAFWLFKLNICLTIFSSKDGNMKTDPVSETGSLQDTTRHEVRKPIILTRNTLLID